MAKKALLVGINYPGTSHSLRGCVNDVLMTNEMLIVNFGWDESEITILTDYEATTANIKNGLKDLVKDAQPGDTLYFHYSGHGSQVPDSLYDTDVEADGMDEILCPIDLDWYSKVVKDDDIREIIKDVHPDVNLTMVLDCCHSGSGADAETQYHVLSEDEAVVATDDPMKSRQLPMPEHLQKFVVKNKARTFASIPATEPGVVVTGCQEYQTSADAYIDGRWCGAATYHLVKVLKENNHSVNYKTLVDGMNAKLESRGYTQRPQLGGDSKWYAENFLGYKYEPPVVEPVEEPAIVSQDDVDTIELEEPLQLPEKDDTKTQWLVVIGSLVVTLLIIMNI